jgi:hypothetical protein
MEAGMATVNFSIPDEIKQAFQEAFAEENKSAVISRLMLRAVEEKKLEKRRAIAIEKLLDLRQKQRPVSDAEIARARQTGRP